MTYPPASSGYPPAQQPSGSYGSPAPSATPAEEGPSKLPLYLSLAVVALGLGAYLGSFGPIYDIEVGQTTITHSVGDSLTTCLAVVAALLAALLAGVSALPKANSHLPIVAVTSVLGLLLTVTALFGGPEEASIKYGLWLVLVFTLLQAVAAVGALLLEAGVITAPAPKPKYDPYAQYGLPPGGYYGQAGGQQQGGYPSYGGYQSAPSTGGFGAQQAPSGPSTGGYASPSQPTQQIQSGQPQTSSTPPTGFPSFSQPPAGGQSPSGPNSNPGQQYGGQGQQAPSSPSGPQQL